jgi:hypothetical protein
MLLLAWVVAVSPVSGAEPAPHKYAGTYKIDSWRSLEARGLFHFFYLHPGGSFLLGAEWPGNEESRSAGTWIVSGDHLSLTGRARVSSNQGSWRVPFRRTFRITVAPEGIRLAPIPEKNRYGLLGWPNAYTFHHTRIDPNLPGGGIPTDGKQLQALMKKLAGG